MKTTLAAIFATAAGGFALAGAPAGEPYWFAGDDATVFPLVSTDFHETWLKDRLSIGLALAHSSLTDAKRSPDKMHGSTFVGFINKLDDEDSLRFTPTISWWAAPFLRFSIFRDGISGRTRNYNTAAKHSDGVVKAEGPAFVAEGMLPLVGDTVFLRAGCGIVWADADFDEETWWHLGYGSADAWKAYGSPSTPAGKMREIDMDDAFGFLVCAGVAWRPIPRLEAELALRHVWLEPDCHYGYRLSGGFQEHSSGNFTLDHLTVSLGVSYVF